MDKAIGEQILAELDALKKLTVLQLLDKGFSQTQIALTLGVGQATISRMFPKGALRKKHKAPEDE
jgi:transcriptional regulator